MIGVVFCCSLGFGLGVVGIFRSLAGAPSGSRSSSVPVAFLGSGSIRPVLRAAVVPSVVGILVAVATGWPVAFLIAAVAVYGLPKLFGQTAGSVSLVKIEAIATWTEMLQGTLAASAGLNQAIMATAPLSPLPIRGAALSLSARISTGVRPEEALLIFGDQLADPCADRVVCSLLLAVTCRAQRLGELLSALAESTRDEVALRLRIETSRASVRSGVRTVLVFSVGFASLLAVLARSYLAPFGSPTGQLVLGLVGILYAGGLSSMVMLSRPPVPIRLLGGEVAER